MRVVYLHGFASSPQSSKARFFGSKFAEAGVAFEAPQLDQGEFRSLTISGQMLVVARAVSANREKLAEGEPLVLVGSSLGGYLAALYAERHPKAVDRLILLAPAFEFLQRWRGRLSAREIEQWRREGSIPIYHYGSKTEQRLGYQFLEDAAQYEAAPDFHQPALILHGTEDTVVSCQVSRDFALERTRIRLALFQSGHELTDVLEDLWRETSGFLEIRGPGVV
jgi:alpha-beta hydrolase superfamily lysophospholipase